jgi:hypothetical protein
MTKPTQHCDEIKNEFQKLTNPSATTQSLFAENYKQCKEAEKSTQAKPSRCDWMRPTTR